MDIEKEILGIYDRMQKQLELTKLQDEIGQLRDEEISLLTKRVKRLEAKCEKDYSQDVENVTDSSFTAPLSTL